MGSSQDQFLSIPSLDNVRLAGGTRFIYTSDNGILSYMSTDNNIGLTSIAVFDNSPELSFNNIQII